MGLRELGVPLLTECFWGLFFFFPRWNKLLLCYNYFPSSWVSLIFLVSNSCYQSSSVFPCTLIYSPCTSHFIASASEWENFYNLWLLNLEKQESFLTYCGVITEPIAAWEGRSMFNKPCGNFNRVEPGALDGSGKKKIFQTLFSSHFNWPVFSLQRAVLEVLPSRCWTWCCSFLSSMRGLEPNYLHMKIIFPYSEITATLLLINPFMGWVFWMPWK